MDKYIFDENNGLWYERCGDYYLPYLMLPEQKSMGKWGQKYRAYLRKHKREVYSTFQSKVALDEHIAEIDQQAEEMFERLVEQIATWQGITERLKVDDQMAWVSAMNHVRSIVEETVLSDFRQGHKISAKIKTQISL